MQKGIYGSYPYNKLGILPNANNLRLGKMTLPILPTEQNTGQEDTVDFPVTGDLDSPASTDVSPIQRLFGLVNDNANSMVNLIIVVIVLIVENLVKGNLFTCPCEKPQNTLYGALFLAAPAAALFVVAIMANNNTWILVTGYCHRQKTDYPKQHHSGCYHTLGVITKAFVAPLAWVIISFIDGKFYTCAASTDPCGTKDSVYLQAQSQVIGFITLIVAMFAAILGMLLLRAARPMSYEQDHYINIYRTMERLEINKQFQAHAQGVARQNVQEFLAKESRTKTDWDYIANVPGLTPTGGLHNGEMSSMSPLDKLMLQERGEFMDNRTAQAGSYSEHRCVVTQENGGFMPRKELEAHM